MGSDAESPLFRGKKKHFSITRLAKKCHSEIQLAEYSESKQWENKNYK